MRIRARVDNDGRAVLARRVDAVDQRPFHVDVYKRQDYWIGFGIPAKEGNTYYAGYGAVPEELGAPVDSIADRTYEENGKTYNTVYFGLKDVDLENGAYVVVKNGEDTAAYRVSFQVTLAPVVENMQVWVVNDQASYERLPADYTGAHPWDDAYLQPENAAALPWLAVSYDSNVTGAVEIQVTKDGTPVGSKSHAESTVNTDPVSYTHLRGRAGHRLHRARHAFHGADRIRQQGV